MFWTVAWFALGEKQRPLSRRRFRQPKPVARRQSLSLSGEDGELPDTSGPPVTSVRSVRSVVATMSEQPAPEGRAAGKCMLHNWAEEVSGVPPAAAQRSESLTHALLSFFMLCK